MKKIIKLNENDLLKIVKNILNEQTVSFSEIKGTTSKEPISSPSVLINAGLNANQSNFTGRWVLSGDKIGKTFRQVRNLSLFEMLTEKSPKGGEDFIEITINRFTKTEFNPNKTVKTPSKLDTATPPKVESLSGSGSKVFETNYGDETDPKYVWKMTKIVASGNGLLALSRALVESKTSYPNRITIGFSEEVRRSSSYQFNASIIGNMTPYLNGFNLMITAYILKINNVLPKYAQGDSYVYKMLNKFSGMSEEEIATYLTQTLYSLDSYFIPSNEIAEFRVKKDTNGQPILKNYNSTSISNLLKTIPKNPTLVRGIYAKNYNAVKNASTEYNNFTNIFIEEITKQYKERVYSFFNAAYGPEQAKKLVNSTNFKNNVSSDLSKNIIDVTFGVIRSGSVQPQKSDSTQRAANNTYDLGSPIPNQERG